VLVLRNAGLAAGLLVVVLSLLAFAGCGDDDDGGGSAAAAEDLAADPELGGASLIEKAKEEGRVVVYTAQTDEQAGGLTEAFEKDFGIDVELVRKPGAELGVIIASEAEAGKLRADVVEQSDINEAERLNEEFDLFETYESPSDAQYPSQYPIGPFYPPYRILHGFAYNTSLVDEADAPKTWEDYLDSAFDGRRAHVAIGGGGCSWALGLFEGKVLSQGQDHTEYWQKVADKDPVLSVSNGQLVQQLAQGELEITTMLDSVARGAIGTGAPIEMVYPPEGLAPCDYASGVVREAEHPNAARLFVNWTLSERGQSVWVEDVGGFSLRKGMPTPEDAPDEVNVWEMPLSEYRSLQRPWAAEWNQMFDYTP
jgi:iron(III) transport system substrate-binding protein